MPWFRFACYGLLGLWVIASDPFGLSSAADRAISEEYADAYSRASPVDMPPLTIVTIDGKSIEELFSDGSGKISVSDWPIAYSDHAAIITKIAKGKPHPPVAIFYDILFEKPRLSSGKLENLNRRVSLVEKVAGIPIFFAAGGPDTPLSEASNEILNAPQLVRTNWHEAPGIYPLSFSTDENLASQVNPSEESNGIEHLSPAMSLYQSYCEASTSCPDTDFNESDFQNSLKIHWPMRSQSGNAPHSELCLSDSTLGRYWDVFWRTAHATGAALFGRNGPAPAPVECLPINTVQVSDLFSDNNPTDLAPPRLAEGHPYVVMVGVVMPSAGDYHQTPVYEKLPGVFFHGAAFENLHRMGSDYYYHKDLTRFSVAIWLLASLALMAHARYREFNPVESPKRVLLFWWTTLALSVLVMQLLFTNVFRIVPEGWLSMMAILPLLRGVVMRREAALLKKRRKNK